MEFKIISDRDEKGNFISSSEKWTPEKIQKLLDKFYPKRVQTRIAPGK